jgi:hypothetical protein
MQFRKVSAVLVGAALLATGLTAAAPAIADTITYDSWVESDDAAPFATTEGLVFYQNASINFGQKNGTELKDLASLEDVSGLAYTVDDSTSYAPSYQLGIVNKTTGITYARLVWEPYMQTPSAGDKTGVYKNLERGKWWGGNVWTTAGKTQPFANGEGSQSSPQPLTFFKWKLGADAQIAFFGVKQGSTSNVVSTVSSLTFEGQKVPLGNVSPLQTQFETAKADLAKAKADLATEKATSASLQTQLNAAKAALTSSQADALAKLVAVQNQATTAQAKLVSISGTAKVGKTVAVKFATAIPGTTATYRWYVGGKAVKSATESSLKLVRSQAGKSLSVKVTTKWTDALGKAQSVAVTVKYLTSTKIAK